MRLELTDLEKRIEVSLVANPIVLKKRRNRFIAATLVCVLGWFAVAIGQTKPDPLVAKAQDLRSQYDTLFVLKSPDCITGSSLAFVDFSNPAYVKFAKNMMELKEMIEKESYERLKYPLNDPKVTVFSPVIGLYVMLQKAMLVNYLQHAHRDKKGVSAYDPSFYDDYNIRVSTLIGTTLLNSKEYQTAYSMRHVPDGKGTRFRAEIFITPIELVSAEMEALAYPRDTVEYTKLLQLTLLRQSIFNRWSLYRMADVNWEANTPPVPACAQDLISFKDIKGKRITDSALYQSLRNQDRYQDFRAAIPKIATHLNGLPVFSEATISRMIREYVATQPGVDEYLKTLGKTKAEIEAERSSIPAEEILKIEKSSLEDDTPVETNPYIVATSDPSQKIPAQVLAQLKKEFGTESKMEYMPSVAKQLFEEHVYLSDDLSAQGIAPRISDHAYEVRKRFVSQAIVDQVITRMETLAELTKTKYEQDIKTAEEEDLDRVEDEHNKESEKKKSAVVSILDAGVSAPVLELSPTPGAEDMTWKAKPSEVSAAQVKATQMAVEKAVFEKKVDESLARLLAQLKSAQSAQKIVSIVNRNAESVEKTWKSKQTDALLRGINSSLQPGTHLAKNRERFNEFLSALHAPAREVVLATRNKSKIETFLKSSTMVTKTWCKQRRMREPYDCMQEATTPSLASSGANDPKSPWAYIGENPTRVHWSKAGITEPVLPLTPDEVSALFGKKLERLQDLPKGSPERRQLEEISKNEVALKYIKVYLAKLAAAYQPRSMVTAENTPLREIMISVGKEVNAQFLRAISEPPSERLKNVPLVKTIIRLPANYNVSRLDNDRVRRSFSDMKCGVYGMNPVDPEGEGIEVSYRPMNDPTDKDYSVVDYQPTEKERTRALDGFRNALSMLGVYEEATGLKPYYRVSEKTLMGQVQFYATAVHQLDKQKPGMLPHERMAASVWDQLLMSEVRILSNQGEMPILALDHTDSIKFDGKNNFTAHLAAKFGDRSFSKEELRPILSNYSDAAVHRDFGKVEDFCSISAYGKRNSDSFRQFMDATSLLRETLQAQNKRLKKFDKELKKDSRSNSQRFLSIMEVAFIVAIVAIILVAGLASAGVIPASIIGMGATGVGASALTVSQMSAGTLFATVLWQQLTGNLAALTIMGWIYTGVSFQVYFIQTPNQLRYMSQVANSQFGIMAPTTVSRAELDNRRRELHTNQIMTIVAGAVDVAFFKFFTVPSVKKMMGWAGEAAVLRSTENNPALREALLQRSLKKLVQQYGPKEGLRQYSIRYKPYLRFKRATPLNPKTASIQGIRDATSYTLSKKISSIDDVVKGLERHIDGLKAERALTHKKLLEIMKLSDGKGGTIGAHLRQGWYNLKLSLGIQGRFYKMHVVQDANEALMRSGAIVRGEHTKVEIRAFKAASELDTIDAQLDKMSLFLKRAKTVKELNARRQAALASGQQLVEDGTETFRYFNRMTPDELLFEQEHHRWLKKNIGDDTFYKATKQTFKDYNLMVQDYSLLKTETIAMLFRAGAKSLGPEMESMVVAATMDPAAGKTQATILANGTKEEQLQSLVDSAVELDYMTKKAAEIWLKKANSVKKGSNPYIYETYVIDSHWFEPPATAVSQSQ